ncbi:MAG: DUF2835 domain-containing protein [Candidatus Sedimenticola sp. (ex Thyasira tokunagai)]
MTKKNDSKWNSLATAPIPGQAPIRFSLKLSAEKFLRYYKGSAHAVIVYADDGRKLQVPARNFRPFITDDGIYGRFELTLDKDNKLLEMKKIS